jgi:TolA-binding protein
MNRPRNRHILRAGGITLALLAGGCATRADLLDQEKRFRSLVVQQNRSLQQVKREVERLRADVEEGHGPRSRSAAGEPAPEKQRIVELEEKIHRLESGSQEIGMTPDPTLSSSSLPEGAPIAPPPVVGDVPPPVPPPPTGGTPSAEPPQQVASATPPPTTPPAPPPPAIDDEWRREVAQDQAVAGTIDVPERAEYLSALQGLSRGDCTQAGSQLSGLSNRSKGSPLADNALYWQARCAAARGDNNRAVTEFYDVVTRYPKSDKAPTALWQQGLLFARMGNAPDARLALSKLIKDYPASAEASRARQKLIELEQ